MRKGQLSVLGSLASWFLAIGVGASILLRYANTPSQLAEPPLQWPHRSIIQRELKGATVVVFVHPQCPCSRATIGELAKIMAQCRGAAKANVYFYAPGSETKDWTRTQSWRDAESIPGVIAREDVDGREARRFGASTSGQVLLYGVDGQLLFNGGITMSRGHSGENDGEDSVVSLLQTGKTRHHTAAVFGCSLRGQE